MICITPRVTIWYSRSMGWPVIINCLLKLPEGFDVSNLHEGQTLKVSRNGERIFPINVPIEMCDAKHQFLAKIAVRKLTVTKGRTDLQVEVLKVFTPEEAAVLTANFIPS